MSNIQEIFKEETIDVFAEDGVSSAITVFGSQDESSLPVITCFPAMGVSAAYYRTLAHSLAKQGLIVVTADLRGIGSSSVRASKQNNFGYFEMIHYDWPAVIKAVKNKFPKNKMYLLGHSLGGQLSSLYLSHQKDYEIAGLILLTVNSVYYKGYGFPDGFKVLVGTNLACLISLFLGYFPGRTFGFGGIEAKNVIRDWSRQGRTGVYEIMNSSLPYEALLAELSIPVISVSFEGDFFAPYGAAQHLVDKMKNAKVKHVHIQPEEYGLKNKLHFSWAKNPDFIVSLIMKWMESQIIEQQHNKANPADTKKRAADKHR